MSKINFSLSSYMTDIFQMMDFLPIKNSRAHALTAKYGPNYKALSLLPNDIKLLLLRISKSIVDIAAFTCGGC